MFEQAERERRGDCPRETEEERRTRKEREAREACDRGDHKETAGKRTIRTEKKATER